MENRLLVGLDGSPIAEQVLPYVETFARATNSPVTLIRAIHRERSPERRTDEHPAVLPYVVLVPGEHAEAESQSNRNERHEAEHYLDQIVQRLGERGISAEAAIIEGDPAKALIEEAQLRHASLMLLCTHGRSGLGKLIHGSVAEAVVAHSTVPVLLVRASKSPTGASVSIASSPIVVPLDGTPTAERALPFASELAKQFKTELKLFEVVAPVDATAVADSGWLMGEPSDVLAEEQSDAEYYLQSVADRLQASGIATARLVGVASIGEGIVRQAADVGAGLIVMATHAKSTLAQALIRSVAADVIHQTQRPVLLIGPLVKVTASDQTLVAGSVAG